jgi:hypothetical protein
LTRRQKDNNEDLKMKFTAGERMAPHSMPDSDEYFHQPPSPLPDRWQENTMLAAWNVEEGHGFLVHTKRWPAKGDHEAHIVVFVDGVASSAILHRPTGKTLRIEDEIPELLFEPEVPWSRWRLQAEIQGAGGVGSHGFFAYAPRGDTLGAIDIIMESDIPVADFSAALAEWSRSLTASGSPSHSSAQAHYEQAGRWHGTLTVGNRKIKTNGLFVRDHSWGERVERGFENGVFWTASALDNGNIFCNAIGFPQPDGSTIGTGILVNQDGAFHTATISAEFTPRPGLQSYEQSKISYGFETPVILTGQNTVHVPKYLPGSGFRRYDNNAISKVQIGDETGMGCIEWCGVLEKHQADDLDRLLLEPAS